MHIKEKHPKIERISIEKINILSMYNFSGLCRLNILHQIKVVKADNIA